MKKLFMSLTVIVLMAGFTTRVSAQATENTAAGAVIITAISITEVTPLHFGVMSSAAIGTCVLSTQGIRTSTGGVDISAQAPVATNAAYNIVGQAGTTYVITLPATIVVSNGTPAQDMTINSLLARTASAGADGLTGTLIGGADSFTVGGTLNVPAAQPAGVYAGAFDVTVAYN